MLGMLYPPFRLGKGCRGFLVQLFEAARPRDPRSFDPQDLRDASVCSSR